MLSLYNSLTKEKEPLLDNEIYWYVCGPTVYDYSHLGHARTYITVDIIRRILENKFLKKVTLIMNVTDIDDKIIERARGENINWLELARLYERTFFEDMSRLNVEMPDILTRVSDYITEIIEFIQILITKGAAYISNGSVYFDLEQYEGDIPFKGHIELEEAENGEKKHKNDFALWKKSEDVGWDSPFGFGRPGWHIECSVMAIEVVRQMKYPPTLTLHSGGIDLMFPHHTNEIIQSQTYLGAGPWVQIFNHIGHLNIQNQKMSKSLKNFIKIRDFLQEYGPKELRMMFLLTKYRQPLEYSEESVLRARDVIRRIEGFINRVKSSTETKFKSGELRIRTLEGEIEKHIQDDLDIPNVIKKMLEMIRLAQNSGDSYSLRYVERIVRKWYYTMFGFKEPSVDHDMLLEIRADLRQIAKVRKDKELFDLTDIIRDRCFCDAYIEDSV